MVRYCGNQKIGRPHDIFLCFVSVFGRQSGNWLKALELIIVAVPAPLNNFPRL